jgi:SRP-independent targeting protein 2/TMEM208
MLYGQVLSNSLPFLIRILLRSQAFRQSKKAISLYCLTLALSQFLYQYLKKAGTPRRDSTGNLLSPGDDLNHPGMTEWIFDILYIACEPETSPWHSSLQYPQGLLKWVQPFWGNGSGGFTLWYFPTYSLHLLPQ